MTPRQRVLDALNHIAPDHPPLDLGSTGTTTLNINAYHRLRQALNLDPESPQFMNFTAQSVKPNAEFLDRLGVDTRGVTLRGLVDMQTKVRDEGEYDVLYDAWGIGYRKPKSGGHYFDTFSHPLTGKGRQEIERYAFPKPNDPLQMEGVAEQCRRVKSQGYAVLFSSGYGFGLLHTGTQLLGYEDYFSRLILEPTVIDGLTAKILEAKLEFWDMVLKDAGTLIDVVVEVDDLGIQEGPFMSPETYKKHIQPFQRKLIGFIKSQAPHIKILHHSCGSIVEFLPALIDMGIDAINPVQISARGMDPVRLKKEFGRDLVFWGGGIDTQKTLPTGSIDRIKDEVRRNISIFGQDGGYVFATVHNIQGDVPVKNILAVFEAFDEFRERSV